MGQVEPKWDNDSLEVCLPLRPRCIRRNLSRWVWPCRSYAYLKTCNFDRRTDMVAGLIFCQQRTIKVYCTVPMVQFGHEDTHGWLLILCYGIGIGQVQGSRSEQGVHQVAGLGE